MTWSWSLALILSLPGARPATPAAAPQGASTGPRNLVVLVDSGAGVATELRGPMSSALQQEVERSVGFKWVEPPAISVDELALALNCSGMDDGCIRRAADTLKADAIMLVSVGAGGRKEIVMSLVQVRPPKPTRLTSIPLGDATVTMQETRGAARSLLGPARPTRLAIVTDPPGAQVTVDGKTTCTSPCVLNDLPEGNHQVAVQLAGHQPQSTQVQLRPGESSEARVTLQVARAAPPPPVVATPTPAPTPGRRPAPEPAPEATTTQPSASSETEAPPAWHRVKYFSPLPGAAALALGVLVVGLGTVVTAWGATPGTVEESVQAPNLFTVLKLANNLDCKKNAEGTGATCSTHLFTQSNAVYFQYAVLGAGISGMVLGGAFVLGAIGLLAASPLPIVFLE